MTEQRTSKPLFLPYGHTSDPLVQEELQRQWSEIHRELDVQAGAADHWFREANRAHNELMRAAQPPCVSRELIESLVFEHKDTNKFERARERAAQILRGSSTKSAIDQYQEASVAVCEHSHVDFGRCTYCDAEVGSADEKSADPERKEVPRCPRCLRIARTTLMGRLMCDEHGDVPMPAPHTADEKSAHQHTDECWEPDSGCDLGRNEKHARLADETSAPRDFTLDYGAFGGEPDEYAR